MIENVVIVVVDALRADRVGLYNEEYIDLTPAINRLGNGGMVFTRAFSTTNTTDPAMTSLHSGRHPKGHGIVNHGGRVTDEEKACVEMVELVPETLQEAGVRTIKAGRALGRWHKRGFDTHPSAGESAETSKHPLLAFWDEYLETRVGRIIYRLSDTIGHRVANVYRDVRESAEPSAMEVCLDAIDDVDSAPFYALVHLMDTHASYNPRDELVHENLKRYDGEDNRSLSELADEFGLDTVTGERCEYWSRRYTHWKNERHGVGTTHIEARYDGAVREADEKIGRLVSGLQARNLLDETMVVVLADHGESLTEHGILHDHHGLYDTTVRIPLVIRAPGFPGGRCDEFVQITDVAPTVLDILGVDHDCSFDGRSLLPLLDAVDGAERDWEHRPGVVAEEAHTQRRRMVRTREEKFIRLLDGDTTCRYCGIEHAPDEELFDLVDDPEETTNLVNEHPERVDELADTLERLYAELLDSPQSNDSRTVYEDEEAIIEHFEALGYR